MIALLRRFGAFSRLLKRARRRGFAGLVLDGCDVNAAVAEETNVALLSRAVEVAWRRGERIWAERFARRACDVRPSDFTRLQLATILAGKGALAEAQALLNEVPSTSDDPLYPYAGAVLHAKHGRVDEAFAAFGTLPGRVKEVRPAPIAIVTAWEMMDQCDLEHTAALVSRLVEDYPSNMQVRSLNIRCRLIAGDTSRVRELSQVPDSVLERTPLRDRRFFIEAVAESLELHGWTSELWDFLNDQIKKDPTHWSLYSRATNNARAASRDGDYGELVRAIPPNVRNSAEVLAILCRWHIDENRFAQAQASLSKLRPLSAHLFLQAQLYFSLHAYADDPTRGDEAYDACVKCGIAQDGPAIVYSFHQYYFNCSPSTLQNCLAKLDQAKSSACTQANFWYIYLRCVVALGDQRRAIECYKALPAGLADSAQLRPFGLYFDAMNGRHLEARAGWTKYIRATRHLCVNAPSSYPKTVDLKFKETPGAVLLFVTLFNAIDYLDWFLAHYRALGVDHFFIIDNGSNDGSRERLRKETDVSLFSNTDSFARSGFGVLWINHLMQRFGVDHWCFHVDIDEGFVFPDLENKRTLRDLLSYCDDRGFGLVPAIEMDMYPESLVVRADSDPFTASCYFDTDYLTIPCELPPYVMIQGGVRKRLTGLALLMQKSPLVRMAPDVRYTGCNHSTTHLPVADVSAALLHYKFVGNLKRRVEEAVSRKEHYGEAFFYRRLDNAVTSTAWAGSLLSPYSHRYGGPESLVRHGLIKSSHQWQNYMGVSSKTQTRG